MVGGDRVRGRRSERAIVPPAARPSASGGGHVSDLRPTGGGRAGPPFRGAYWLGGRQAVQAAMRHGRIRRLVVAAGATGLDALWVAAAAAGVTTEQAPRSALDRLVGTDAQGCAALVDPIAPVDLEAHLRQLPNGAPALLVACDHLQDPHNLGAIARTAEAVGAVALIIPSHRAAGLSAGAERSAAGALQSLPCAVVHNLTWALDRCRSAGFWTYGAALDGQVEFSQVAFAARAVIVVGAEARGLSPSVRRHCDVLVRLPMRGSVQSLNAAVAAGVLMYEWTRQIALVGRDPAKSSSGPSGGGPGRS